MGRKRKGRGGKRAKTNLIDDLPPEMLMAVFKYLPTQTLVSSCRVVNRKFNEISSDVLRHRPKTLINFFLGSGGSFLRSDIPNEFDAHDEKEAYEYAYEYDSNKKTLAELVDCYKKSKNFPFARFSFKDFYGGGKDLKTFLTKIGFKILSIRISPPENVTGIKLLRKLLTEYCPNLQELIFDDFNDWPDDTKYSGNLKLFNGKTKIISLPNLKILRLSLAYEEYLGVVESILRAASSLKEIRGEWEDEWSSINVNDVEFLSKYGKLHLIKSATLKGDELVEYWRKYPGQTLKLSKMTIKAKNIHINTLIEHSKDTLKELVILRSENIVPDVNWSLIPNLQKLSLPANENPRTLFPATKNIILPNLKELEIESTGSPGKKSKARRALFPSVKLLKPKFNSYSSRHLKSLAITFPNVSCLDLSSVENFSEFGKVIWTNMKYLMTLHVLIPKIEPNYYDDDSSDYDEDSSFDYARYGEEEKLEYTFPLELDSCFTGYSKSTCDILKWAFDGVTEVSDKVVTGYERKHPSILDMKHLTTLRLKYCTHECISQELFELLEAKKQTLAKIKQRFSVVSHLFAFQQMPNLEVAIDTEVTDLCMDF